MYVFCDCSDCGNSRVKGPCYLEIYYNNLKSQHHLNELRRRNTKTKGTQKNFFKVENEDKDMFKDSVLRISII